MLLARAQLMSMRCKQKAGAVHKTEYKTDPRTPSASLDKARDSFYQPPDRRNKYSTLQILFLQIYHTLQHLVALMYDLLISALSYFEVLACCVHCCCCYTRISCFSMNGFRTRHSWNIWSKWRQATFKHQQYLQWIKNCVGEMQCNSFTLLPNLNPTTQPCKNPSPPSMNAYPFIHEVVIHIHLIQTTVPGSNGHRGMLSS